MGPAGSSEKRADEVFHSSMDGVPSSPMPPTNSKELLPKLGAHLNWIVTLYSVDLESGVLKPLGADAPT